VIVWLCGGCIQLSNEIIRRCCKEINLDRIFAGYVQSSMKMLHECISCCDQWKDIYRKVVNSDVIINAMENLD